MDRESCAYPVLGEMPMDVLTRTREVISECYEGGIRPAHALASTRFSVTSTETLEDFQNIESE